MIYKHRVFVRDGIRYLQVMAFYKRRMVATTNPIPFDSLKSIYEAEGQLVGQVNRTRTFKAEAIEKRLSIAMPQDVDEQLREFLAKRPLR